MFASALAGLDARRRSAGMGSPQVVPDSREQPPSPTNNPIITVVTPTSPTSPASSTSSFAQSPKQSDTPPSGQLRRPFAQAPRQAPQQPQASPSAQHAAPPAPAKPPAIVTPSSPTAQPARERQGSDPLQRSQTLRNGRPPPLRASDCEQTESDDEEEGEEEEEEEEEEQEEED